MKRIGWLLAAAVLLGGCSSVTPEQTTAPQVQMAPTDTEAARTPGIYDPLSDLEARTGGAVRCYQPDLPDAYGMRLIGGDVLVFSGSECTTLTRYTGENLTLRGQITLECRLEPEDSSFQISEHGVTYFDPGTNNLVYLDNDLKEVSRLKLAEGLVGKPVLSSDRTRVFYCTADAVRVYDVASGLDKLIKSISYPSQTLDAVLMEDSILCCILTDEQGQSQRIFLSAETGQGLGRSAENLELVTDGNRWIARTDEGVLRQVIFGGEDGSVQVLYSADPFADAWIQPENFSVVTASMEVKVTRLGCYDLESGMRTAAVELPGTVKPWCMESVPDSDRIYILAHDGVADCPVILGWDSSATPTEDSAVYTGPRYTAQYPDEAGLADCAARAAAIGEAFGLKILIGREAASVQPADYSLEYEYQVSLIRHELTVLEDVLKLFPRDFFRKLHGQTTVCILRSITGDPRMGSVTEAQGVQFWDGDKAYVALIAGDSLAQSFCHEIFHVIDSKVLSASQAYYRWDSLNPEGFTYFQDFTSYLTADAEQYLEDENRAFIDAYSMSYPREDRARIMEYACMKGNAHYFRSEIMQNKLKTLCEGIREAFGMEKYQGDLLWEQYLEEPLKIK